MQKLRKKTLSVLACITLVTASFFYSCNKNSSENELSKNETFAINFTPAKTSNELTQLRLESKSNVIRNSKDLDNILALKNTPLSKLSTQQLNEFKSEIVYRDGLGVVGFKYEILQSNLSEEDFNTVMNYFGIDSKNGFWGFSKNKDIVAKLSLRASSNGDDDNDNDTSNPETGTDYKEYKCVSAHNCEMNDKYICLSGC